MHKTFYAARTDLCLDNPSSPVQQEAALEVYQRVEVVHGSVSLMSVAPNGIMMMLGDLVMMLGDSVMIDPKGGRLHCVKIAAQVMGVVAVVYY